MRAITRQPLLLLPAVSRVRQSVRFRDLAVTAVVRRAVREFGAIQFGAFLVDRRCLAQKGRVTETSVKCQLKLAVSQ
jgi:hypothetical protein